ncbi:MAG: TIGR03084 family protein [Deltaproteobacteria bacterium]|nr:TIGR03084 family protein [Deltaproteobacteria bacterium]
MEKICTDLNAQYQELDDAVADLNKEKWYLQTPFYQWTIFDQVAHIAFFDREALLAIETPERFKQSARQVMQILLSDGEWPSKTNPLLGAAHPEQLISLWRKTRADLLNRLRQMNARGRIIWYGPDMSARSFATARLMETWAHTQDVCDTLRLKRENTDRLRHVAHLGVTTFAWSFKIRKLSPPAITPRVELAGPSGERWVWGEPEALEKVCGSAEEFCLVVTQRRNLADTRLQCEGEHVRQWLAMAQAFAGIPQEPPPPGERVLR